MVLTRSVRSQLLTAGVDLNTVYTMEDIPRTVIAPIGTNTVTAVSSANTGITPSVQQFLTLAQDPARQTHQDSHNSSYSIPSPDYSSLTIQNELHNLRSNTVPSQAVQAPSRDLQDRIIGTAGLRSEIVGLVQGEMSRQLQGFQATIEQQIGQALNRVVGNLENARAASAVNANNIQSTQTRPLPATNFSQTSRADPLFLPTVQPNINYNLPHTSIPQNFSSRASLGQPVYGLNNNASQLPPGSGNIPPSFASPWVAHPNDNYPTNHTKIDLTKWGIKFDGSANSMSAEEFIFRVDTLRADFNLSFNELRRNFPILLEGQARDWFYNFRKLNPVLTWNDLVSAFLSQFRRYESEFQLQKRIMDRRQGPQEPFESFFNAVLKLRNQQRSPYSEKDLIEIMKSNLKPALSHLLFSAHSATLNDFCQQAKKAENLIASQRPQYSNRPVMAPRVHELDQESEDFSGADFEVDAIANRSRYTCWNCKLVGHSFIDCPTPITRTFCFRCGQENVVAPSCPRCQGNQRRYPSQTGETRTTES